MRKSLRAPAPVIVLVASSLTACGVGSDSSSMLGKGHASLPAAGEPRPGPDLLYWPAPTGTQLENTGIWRAEPIRISGTSAYRAGEFLYQDYIYDDPGTYPQGDAYRGNAADLVELRLKPVPGATAFRISYNTLVDPQVVATTIALGTSASAVSMPHDAATRTRAQLFVTVHGTSATVVDASSGNEIPTTTSVAVDVPRRQVELRLPHAVFNPTGRKVRISAATGLWSAGSRAYMDRGTSGSRFFNVAFRFNETEETNLWGTAHQAEALSAGDIGDFFAEVDFAKLAAGVDDDMPGQPGGVPQSGRMVRIYASHFETRQGRRQPGDPNGGASIDTALGPSGGDYGLGLGVPCRGDCVPDYPGRLQPYAIYVPQLAANPDGYGLQLFVHGANTTHQMYTTSGLGQNPGSLNRLIAERVEQPTIVVAPLARGLSLWYYGQAAADIFEVWADVARAYRLDPLAVTMSGMSMGGYGANKLSNQFPDAFGRALMCDGLSVATSFPFANGVFDTLPVETGTTHEPGSNVIPLFPSRRNLPVIEYVGAPDDAIPYYIQRERANNYALLQGYDYQFYTFPGVAGSHFAICGGLEWDAAAWNPVLAWIGDMRRVVDPAHVTYVRNPLMDEPELGVVGDRAYWLSNIQVRDPARKYTNTTWTSPAGDTGYGTIDVLSHGFGLADPQGPVAPQLGAGMLGTHAYLLEYKDLSGPTLIAVDNRLEINAINVSAVTIDVARARVRCDATLDVTTDGPLQVTLKGCDRTVATGGGG